MCDNDDMTPKVTKFASECYEAGYAAASKNYEEMLRKSGQNISAIMVKINCEVRSKIMKDNGDL
jgi:hypothetical protein